MKLIEAKQVIGLLREGWPGDMTTEAEALYIDGLSDLVFADVAETLRDMLRVEEWRPPIAKIRRAVGRRHLPDRIEAERQARRYLDYRTQLAFVNGSGYEPEEPDVHESVRRACDGIDPESPGWRRAFGERMAAIEVEPGTSRPELNP